MSNCQELYFLEDTSVPILQTDASDYSIGGYLYMVTDGKVRPIRFYSKALTGSHLNWSAREKECYDIELLDNRYLILKTDHKNLTYINVTFTEKVLRWKLYLQDKNFELYHVTRTKKHQFVPDALSRLWVNNNPPPPTATESVLRPAVHLEPNTYRLIKQVHNKEIGHWGLDIYIYI